MKVTQLSNLTKLEQSAIINHLHYDTSLSDKLKRVIKAHELNKDNVCDVMYALNHYCIGINDLVN